jgi:hypothetical protein
LRTNRWKTPFQRSFSQKSGGRGIAVLPFGSALLPQVNVVLHRRFTSRQTVVFDAHDDTVFQIETLIFLVAKRR